MSDRKGEGSNNIDMQANQDEKSSPLKVSLWAVTKSVFAAMFGVQSAKNRERDFTHGSARHYIVIGVIATLLFIFTLITIVSYVT